MTLYYKVLLKNFFQNVVYLNMNDFSCELIIKVINFMIFISGPELPTYVMYTIQYQTNKQTNFYLKWKLILQS